jgi:hypothetical protein
MATIQSMVVCDCSTLANFKSWAGAIRTALSTFGWVQSADTGQMVFASVTLPAVNTTVYEIWNMADTLQATSPVFLKIEYGTGTTTAIPALFLTMGTGSNGAGTLTNASGRTPLYNIAGGGAATTYECDFSGSTNRFSFYMWRLTNAPPVFSIERAHDTSGNDLGTYFSTLLASQQASTPFVFQQTVFPAASGGPMPFEAGGITSPTHAISGVWGTNIAVTPFFPMVGFMDNPLLGLMCIKTGDFADGANFTMTVYGASHNYVALKSNTIVYLPNGQTGNSLAIRYE